MTKPTLIAIYILAAGLFADAAVSAARIVVGRQQIERMEALTDRLEKLP